MKKLITWNRAKSFNIRPNKRIIGAGIDAPKDGGHKKGLVCLECGKNLDAIVGHLVVHNMSAREYKLKHNLKRGEMLAMTARNKIKKSAIRLTREGIIAGDRVLKAQAAYRKLLKEKDPDFLMKVAETNEIRRRATHNYMDNGGREKAGRQWRKAMISLWNDPVRSKEILKALEKNHDKHRERGIFLRKLNKKCPWCHETFFNKRGTSERQWNQQETCSGRCREFLKTKRGK
jgi:hypothetical protein